MSWRFVEQPDNNLAIFSEIVDNFTWFHFTNQQAVKYCIKEGLLGSDVIEKIRRARQDPGRWIKETRTIEKIHGMEKLESMLRKYELWDLHTIAKIMDG